MTASSAPQAERLLGPRRIPLRALGLSALALAVPVLGQMAGWADDGSGLLLWLLALVPPFLLAYYRGWGGASTALAAGMALLALAEAVRAWQGVSVHSWTLLFAMVAIYVIVSLAAGALSEALHRQRLLAERRAAEVVWVLDGDETVLFASPSAEAVTGLPDHAYVGRRLRELDEVHMEEAPAGIETVEGVPVDVNITTERYGRRTVEVELAPLQRSDEGTVAVGRDVTVQRRLQNRAKGSERLQALGRLAGGVAHDFNNVITIVTGHAELLLEREDLPDDVRASLSEVAQAAEHATSLTRQLLVFSRNRPMPATRLEVGAVVQRTRPLLRRVLAPGTALDVEVEPGAGQVLATPSQIEQILINLATNARDAMDGGGRFSIRVEAASIDAGTAASHPYTVRTGRYVRLRVRDTGVGMDEATRLQVFEPFFTTKPAEEGTGLGLSTVYGIIKQRGGYIWVDSAPGRGTRFDIYLPLVGAAVEPGDPAAPADDARADVALVVERDDETLARLREALQRVGYSVVEARSGREAIQELEGFRGTLSVLVAELAGPGMSGRELGRRLRRSHPGMRVLHTAPAAGAGEAGRAGEEVLAVPVDPAELRRLLDPEGSRAA